GVPLVVFSLKDKQPTYIVRDCGFAVEVWVDCVGLYDVDEHTTYYGAQGCGWGGLLKLGYSRS
ncbi:hypothetical protein LINPERHAP2_LOCUS20497, partial [Linum perenne]